MGWEDYLNHERDRLKRLEKLRGYSGDVYTLHAPGFYCHQQVTIEMWSNNTGHFLSPDYYKVIIVLPLN